MVNGLNKKMKDIDKKEKNGDKKVNGTDKKGKDNDKKGWVWIRKRRAGIKSEWHG